MHTTTVKAEVRCLVWIDKALHLPHFDERVNGWDVRTCRAYANRYSLVVARTVVTSAEWQNPPLTVLRDQLCADEIGIVVVPNLMHIDLDEARTFAEVHSATSGTVYPRKELTTCRFQPLQ
ncbi:hypothetical protein [Nocardia transvalensis]|uniref:hypothetical protein n=1 Tax=Nocardia transvalensis TaxID=37333 RepID=UPI0018932C14|nr:hypothetical protein [Nocardia transvalensis]MBF6330877.1 hypothetical protein [Nocardia transvalensis]